MGLRGILYHQRLDEASDRRAGRWRATFDDPAPASAGSYLPLLAFHRSWPAFAFALRLAARERQYLALAAIPGVLFARPIIRQGWDLWCYTSWFALDVVRRRRRGPA